MKPIHFFAAACVLPVLAAFAAGCTQQHEPVPQPEADAAPPMAETRDQVRLANPASENCARQGGRLVLESDPNGGQYGVCYFEDNYQCEEWALLRGRCRPGGVRITGYATAAGRFCAITGGKYSVTSGDSAEDEQGTCTLADGRVCDAEAYYRHSCG